MKNKQNPNKTPITGGITKGFRIFATVVIIVTLMLNFGLTVFAEDDPLAVVNNLSDFIFGLIRAIGIIMLGFGIVQVGMSIGSHDASQRANGFLVLGGGILITFSKEIISIVTG